MRPTSHEVVLLRAGAVTRGQVAAAAERRRLLKGLLLVAAASVLLLGAAPAPAGARRPIDFDVARCPTYLGVSTSMRVLGAAVALGLALVAIGDRVRGAGLLVRLDSLLVAVTALLLLASGGGLHWFIDQAPPWPSYEELCELALSPGGGR